MLPTLLRPVVLSLLLAGCATAQSPWHRPVAFVVPHETLAKGLPRPALAKESSGLPELPALPDEFRGALQEIEPDDASLCRRLAQGCTLAERLAGHHLPAEVLLWRHHCSLALRCAELAGNARTLEERLAAIPPVVLYAPQGEEEQVTLRYAQTLPSRDPELARLLTERVLAVRAREQFAGRVAAWQARLVLHTALALVGPDRGGQVYVGGQLPRLVRDPELLLAVCVPATPAYQRLVAAHARYAGAVAAGGFPRLPERCLQRPPRGRDACYTALARRLAAEGLLVPAPAPDEGKRLLDGPLRGALLAFQRLHLQAESGRLDKETRRHLAIPAREKLRRVRLALTAYRRAVRPWEPTFVLVQMPQAFLEFHADGTFVRLFRTILGRADGDGMPFRTPSLTGTITRVVFNPEWHVPQSIAENELEPLEARHPGTLARRGFTKVALGEKRYRYVQRPGRLNALGRVKFHFSNSADVYLHDTPDKRLFRRRRRLFSHGCVRVSQARKLAALLLSRDRGLTWDGLRRLLAGETTTEVSLTTPVPVHLLYSSAAADSHGRLFFMEDAYGLEPQDDGRGR